MTVNSEFTKSVVEKLRGRQFDERIVQLLVKALSTKSLEESKHLIECVEQILPLVPTFADAVGRAVASVRSMPLNDLAVYARIAEQDHEPCRKVSPGRAARRPSTVMTPKRRAALKVQGRYLGLLRCFNKEGQDQIKKVGREKGNAAAIEVMERSLRTRAVRGRKIIALQKSGKLTSKGIDRILGIKRPRSAASASDLLPTNQAADYLVISRSAFRERIAKGLIKPTEVRTVQGERARYFSKDDLRRHVAKHPVRDDHRHGGRKAANR